MPTAIGETVVPVTIATAEFEEVNVHSPTLVDKGATRVKEPTLSFEIVTFVNVPMAGVSAVIVKVTCAVACFQLPVAN